MTLALASAAKSELQTSNALPQLVAASKASRPVFG
jgi:hypothetical protein